MCDFIPSKDFLKIIDSPQNVQMVRAGSSENLSVTAAVQSDIKITAPEDAVKTFRRESIWTLTDEIYDARGEKWIPLPGDKILDTSKSSWTILETKHFPLTGRWKCKTLDVRLTYGLDTWLHFFRAKWNLNNMGVPVPEYELKMTGINAKIIPLETSSKTGFNELLYEIFFETFIDPMQNDCFQTPDSRRFLVKEFHPNILEGNISRCVVEKMNHLEVK
ncbi:MAG: hypothetical protein Q4C96_00185 [Planctomycetia bacterium]|nr:hypothetical protein [Planctomycetia bacterium]